MTVRRTFRTGVLIALSVAFLACQAKAAAVQLRLKLDKGKTYYQRTVIEQQLTQDIMGQQQRVGNTIGTGLKLQVLDVGPQGSMRIQYTYIWSRFKSDNPMSLVDYDSSRPDPAPAGGEGFAALLGQSYIMEVTPDGKVLKAEGMKELQEAVLKKLPAGMQGTPTMQALTPFVEEKAIRQMAEGSLAVYPDGPVEPGSAWMEKAAVNMGFPMFVESKWTLLKYEGGVATVAETCSIRADPEGPPIDTGGMKMKADLSGAQEGIIQIDGKSGLITSNKARQQIKGDLKIGASAEAPPMMTIPVTIDTQVTVEMSDKMWEQTAK